MRFACDCKCGLRLKAKDWPLYVWRKFTEWLDGGHGRRFYRDAHHAHGGQYVTHGGLHIEDLAEFRDAFSRAMERGSRR